MKIYKRRRRRLEVSFGTPFPEQSPAIPKKPKNIARLALDVRAYLTINSDASYGTAAKHYNISRARISQLIKIVDNLPVTLLKQLVDSEDLILLKKYSGKYLLKLASTNAKGKNTP